MKPFAWWMSTLSLIACYIALYDNPAKAGVFAVAALWWQREAKDK